MATVSTSVHLQETNIKLQDHSDDDPYSPNTRDTNSPEYNDKEEERNSQSTSFSIHNVLKKEIESHSPENVFSTNKLLESTPNYEESHDSRNSESVSPRLEGDERGRADISVDDDNSCCSDDTVLSVGNEAPPEFDKSREPPGLTSFKHIQTHLNAISQLSQNLNQPLLLRPNPITPNPLMFLNQPMLFPNPIMNQVKSGLFSQSQPNSHYNIGYRKNSFEQVRRTDENRHYPKSPDEESSRDFINQSCLKFSIDNILKADFGRRITDPLHKRRSFKAREVKAPVVSQEAVPQCKVDCVEARVPDMKEKGGAIDLSKSDDSGSNHGSTTPGSTMGEGHVVWPAWVYCTRYSDRPSSGRSKYARATHLSSPRTRRPKKPPGDSDEKRPRTAFSGPQLARLKHEFAENRYLTERRRQALAAELGLAEAQIKIWFQNKRAKIKKASGQRNPLALQLMAQGLYNHSTVPLTKEEEELEKKAREREQQKLI